MYDAGVEPEEEAADHGSASIDSKQPSDLINELLDTSKCVLSCTLLLPIVRVVVPYQSSRVCQA